MKKVEKVRIEELLMSKYMEKENLKFKFDDFYEDLEDITVQTRDEIGKELLKNFETMTLDEEFNNLELKIEDEKEKWRL